MEDYLIICENGTYLDVKGKKTKDGLEWIDKRDNSSGVSKTYIKYYPRPLSKKEMARGVK